MVGFQLEEINTSRLSLGRNRDMRCNGYLSKSFALDVHCKIIEKFLYDGIQIIYFCQKCQKQTIICKVLKNKKININ